MQQPKIRITKSGKIHKSDIEKARSYVKQELASINKSELPKQLQGYYEQVKKARERIVVREPITGKIIGGKLRQRVIESINEAQQFTGLTKEELLKKENYKNLFQQVLSLTVGFSGTLSGIDKYLQLGYTYGSQLNDGNGNLQMPIEELYSKIITVNKYLLEYGFFTVFYKGQIEASGKVTIFIDDEILSMAESDEETTPEDLQEILNKTKSGMVAIKS